MDNWEFTVLQNMYEGCTKVIDGLRTGRELRIPALYDAQIDVTIFIKKLYRT
jgi:hypothetical protein